MAKPEQIPIEHHLSSEELLKRIKSLEKDTRVLQRLYFVKHRYEGASVTESAKLVGTSKPVAYQWQERWNKDGYDGLIPRFAGGCPSKLFDEQKEKLKEKILHQRDDWSTKEVKELIFNKFNVTADVGNPMHTDGVIDQYQNQAAHMAYELHVSNSWSSGHCYNNIVKSNIAYKTVTDPGVATQNLAKFSNPYYDTLWLEVNKGMHQDTLYQNANIKYMTQVLVSQTSKYVNGLAYYLKNS